MTDYFMEDPSIAPPTREECLELQRERKRSVLEELDRQMVFRYQAGLDYSRLKWRKVVLLQRIQKKATAMYLALQRSAVH